MAKVRLNHRRLSLGITLVTLAAIVISLMPPLAVRNGAYELYRAAALQKVRWERRSMTEIGSGAVRVYHGDEDQSSAELVLGLFEQHAATVARDYGYGGQLPAQVIIHPSRRSLAESMGWSSGDSALGVYWGGSIKLLSPTVWLAGKDQAQVETLYRQTGPVVHEYTHLVIDHMTSGNIPRWLNEGLAQVEEQRLTGYQWLEKGSIISEDRMYPLHTMDAGFDKLANQPLAYHQSYTMARFLMETQGQDRVNSLLREMGKGYTLDQALARVAGFGLSRFEQSWRRWVLTEYRMGAS